MMRRSLTLLLSAYLGAWVPLGFAVELFASAATIDMRGPAAIVELAAHAAVAVLCATAGYMCLIRSPAAAPLAAAAVLAAAGVAVQSLFWTALPRQVAPGETLPLLIVSVTISAFWLFVVAVAVRSPRETRCSIRSS